MALFLEEYEKLRMLGKGSFASVYKVRHHDLGYIRAIKVSNEVIDDENDRAYKTFLNECRVLLKIGNGCHPNIVRIYQPRLIANKAIVEMDYIDGITLCDYLQRHKFVEYDEVARFAREIVGAMAYCHVDLYKFLMDPDADDLQPDPSDGSRYLIDSQKESQLIAKYCVNHNDLHSNNIMRRNYDGSFVLLDFGLAIQDNHCVKSSSRARGAHEYSSPEKLRGETITSASDVYSLGILLYEILAGRVPFPMDTEKSEEVAVYEVYKEQTEQTPPPIEPLRKAAFEKAYPGETYTRDYPEALDYIIMKCLEKDPKNRYPDAKALRAALVQSVENSVAVPAAQPLPAGAPSDVDNDAEMAALKSRLASADALIKQANKRVENSEKHSMQIEKSLFTLRNAVKEAQEENGWLKAEIARLQSQSQKRKFSTSGLWVLTFCLLLASVIASVVLFLTTDYWRQSDAMIDKVIMGAGALSLGGMLIVGLMRKTGMLMWALTGTLIALTATLQFTSSFAPVQKYCMSGATILAMVAYMAMWIANERRRSDFTSSSDDDHTPTPNAGGGDDDSVEVAEVV